MPIRNFALSVLALVAFAECARAAGDTDREMLNLARERGCLLCHEYQAPSGAVQQMSPPAPSFVDIAKHYRGVAGAEARLTATVLEGTGPRPADHHWAGKISSDRMLPNAVEVSPQEARELVHWILSLGG
jgi:cytochrome c551/c552